MTPSAPAARRTQAQRRESARGRLLDATLASLVEVGYARTTTQGVADRAGLSRGAQLHYFPTKDDLVVAAVEHLALRRHAEVRGELADRAGQPVDLAAGVQLLAGAFDGPLFLAALELWVAARTDPALRSTLLPLERRLGAELGRLCGQVLGVDPASASGAAAAELTLELLRGLGIAALLSGPERVARRRERLVTAWADALPALAGDPQPQPKPTDQTDRSSAPDRPPTPTGGTLTRRQRSTDEA